MHVQYILTGCNLPLLVALLMHNCISSLQSTSPVAVRHRDGIIFKPPLAAPQQHTAPFPYTTPQSLPPGTGRILAAAATPGLATSYLVPIAPRTGPTHVPLGVAGAAGVAAAAAAVAVAAALPRATSAPNLRIPERALVGQTGLVGLVLHVHVSGQPQDLLDGIPKPIGGVPVGAGLVPDGDDVLAVADGDDGAADLPVGGGELLAEDGQDDLLPVPGGQALPQPHNPLATLGVAGVLPRRLDAVTEEVVVRRGREVVGTDQMVVHLPEFLDGVDGGNGFDGRFVRHPGLGLVGCCCRSGGGVFTALGILGRVGRGLVLGRALPAAHEPEGISGLERRSFCHGLVLFSN